MRDFVGEKGNILILHEVGATVEFDNGYDGCAVNTDLVHSFVSITKYIWDWKTKERTARAILVEAIDNVLINEENLILYLTLNSSMTIRYPEIGGNVYIYFNIENMEEKFILSSYDLTNWQYELSNYLDQEKKEAETIHGDFKY